MAKSNVLLVATLIVFLSINSYVQAANVLGTDQFLESGQGLNSGNGFYNLRMQGDCNLVLYRVSDGRALWSTKTDKKASGCRVKMQSDGNLVIYSDKNLAVWSSRTARGSDNYNLEMQGDGNVVIYTSKHVAIWATNTVQ